MKFEYNTDDYIRKINSGNSYFNTFLDKNTLAAGVLVLKPGEEDTQLPHESDGGDDFTQVCIPVRRDCTNDSCWS